jgi:ribosome recycling factor
MPGTRPLDQVKKAVKDGLPEDLGKRTETDLQELVNKYVKHVDEIVGTKEKEIMTV